MLTDCLPYFTVKKLHSIDKPALLIKTERKLGISQIKSSCVQYTNTNPCAVLICLQLFISFCVNHQYHLLLETVTTAGCTIDCWMKRVKYSVEISIFKQLPSVILKSDSVRSRHFGFRNHQNMLK